MRKLWLIAWHAYSQRARKPWFLFFYFGLPLLYAALLGVSLLFFAVALQGDRRPVGVVDQAHIIQAFAKQGSPARGAPSGPPSSQWGDRAASPWDGQGQVALLSFADESAAHQALVRGDIQGYYLIGPDYFDTGRVIEVAPHPISPGPEGQFTRLLRDQLLAQTPPERRARLARENAGFLPHRTLDNNDFQLQYLLKTGLAWGMLFVFGMLSTITSFFLMNMLVEEHTNRTAEVLLSSVSPEQLLAGKIIGLSALGLTAPVVWGGVGALALPSLLRVLSDYGLEAAVRVPWPFILLCAVLFLPAYMLNGISAALAGAIVGTTGQGYRIVSFITGMVPTLLWMPAALIAYGAPSAPASLFLSLFPVTAPIALPMRAAQVVVPAWQMALGIGLLYLTLALGLRYSARIYRASWLIEGQKLPERLRSLWLALRGS